MLEPSLPDVRAALVAAGITGVHRSHARGANLGKVRDLVEGREPDAAFGLTGLDKYSAGEILVFMSEATGCSANLDDELCEDFIDPDKTIAGLLAAGRLLGREAQRGGSLLAATGHPTGVLELYLRISDAFVAAGGKQARLREGEKFPLGSSGRSHEIRYVGGVGCVADWGSLKHTHAPDAMEALLDSGPWPDLVLGDHGFAGAAIERGIPTIAIMDINDHALAVAAAERKDVLIVPLDDNRPPRLYEPAARLLEHVIRQSADE